MSTLLTAPVKQFGLAVVRFDPRKNEEAWRNGPVLSLPLAFEELEMHSLLDGEQFLAWADKRAYFGGTDEEPFVVRLSRDHLERFQQGGEEAFYEGLKPDYLRHYERLLGVEPIRQGDVWALPLGHSWEWLQAYYHRTTGGQQALALYQGTKGVRGTRHVVEGYSTKQRVRIPHPVDGSVLKLRGLAAEGVLQAFDHEDCVLTGPHLLMRTQGIVNRMSE